MKKSKCKILFLLGCFLGILLSINVVYADGIRLNKSKIQWEKRKRLNLFQETQR